MTDTHANRVHGVYAYNTGCRCDVCKLAARVKSRAYYIANKKRINERNRKWQLDNPEKVAASIERRMKADPEGWAKAHLDAVKRHRARNPEAAREWDRQHRLANPARHKATQDRYKAKHPNAQNEAAARWRKNNPGKQAAASARWRAANPKSAKARDARNNDRRRTVECYEILPGEWERTCARFRHECAYCGERPGRLTQDHVIALSRGGRHSIGNLVPSCQSCNSSKNASLIVEWRNR